MRPTPLGDVPVSCADADGLARDVGFEASTPIEVGVGRFVAWYRDDYKTGCGPQPCGNGSRPGRSVRNASMKPPSTCVT